MIAEREYKEIINDASVWGRLFQPIKHKPTDKTGIRVVIFGSTTAGHLVIESLAKYEIKFPGKVNLVGVATDDPVDPGARISVKKRIWNYYDEEARGRLKDLVINSCINLGIPCYTGAVKTPYFRDILKTWDPELIIMCCFGQLVDAFIYNYPHQGMYNFHPSELTRKIGAGARPFDETMRSQRLVSHMSMHKVTEEIDAGPIIGVSPPINICMENGSYPPILCLQEKIPSVCGWMAVELIQNILIHREKSERETLHCVNFQKAIPDALKQKLMEPALEDPYADYSLPLHFLLNDIEKDGKI
jgi:hypothetical protein